MHPAGETRHSRKLLVLMAVMLAISILPSSSVGDDFPTGPGLDWTLPQSHGLYISGADGSESLERILPSETGQPDGDREFGYSPFGQNLLALSSPPATEASLLQGNLTVKLYAGLYAQGTQCKFGGDAWDTQFLATVFVGDTPVMEDAESNSVVLENDWNNAHEFTIEAPIDALLNTNETITLDISVIHNCQTPFGGQGHLFWDTYDLASGLQIDAELLTPSLNISVSSNGLPRIEFTPHSPFGTDDYDELQIDIIGPLDTWEQGVHYPIPPEEDQFQDRLKMDAEHPPHGSRQTDTGRIAWTWITKEPLDEGMYVVDLCATMSDGIYTIDCHLIGVLRFEVKEAPSAWFASGWFAVMPIISVLGLMGYLVQTRLPPWPALIVICLMAATSMTAMTALPDIGPGEQQSESSAPDFILLKHGNGSANLGDLLDGRDALILGVFTAGSPAADLQMEDFLEVQDNLGDSVSFAQLITGEGVEIYDGDSHAAKLNGSWALMIDESDGAVAQQLPTGVGEGVIIIDSAGFIVDWHASTMNPIDIKKAVETAESGGGRTPFEFLQMSNILVFLPLLLLGLPRERIEAPETVMIPAAGWIGTAGSASIGFALWALPVAILSIFGAMLWSWVQAILIGWLIWQTVAMLVWQRLPEVDWVSNQVYKQLPDDYRAWRSEDMWTWDSRMGHWFAWLSWLAMPTLIGQGVGSRIASGGMGFLMGPIMLIVFILIAGIVTLLIRLVAAWGGPISRLAGTLTRPVAVRSWGAINAGIVIWLAMWYVFGPLLG
ncbi:MAG TPA: hypothetical protein QF716_04855 [Candidatus Thalassarchaeaceae archaeon]|nr:hypothetical protein [Candidatus Thalassarchaeaceae archaeon]